MKKSIVLSIIVIIVIIVIILMAFVFDWGRRGSQISEMGFNAMNENILQNSTSTSEMPIVVNNIKDNQEVYSPIKIEGKARGNWFFEATFPVQLIDTNGDIVTSTQAHADGDWMTTDFVNFTATLEYSKSTTTDRALIVLSKDNPSGNPDFDQSIFIPVILR